MRDKKFDTHRLSAVQISMIKNEYASVDTAIETLNKGELIGLPTETVYGLGANALDDKAVAKIYALKERPQFNPLIAHFSSREQAQRYVHFNEGAHKLATAFWPGPLTLILPQKKGVGISSLATAGLETLACRVPAHNKALEILRQVDFPLVAPSANPSESISPTTATHVQQAFPGLCVIDGGPCVVGLESTIVDLTQEAPVILRPGSLTSAEIESVLGCSLGAHTESKITAPGQLKRHYAPTIPLRLNVTDTQEGEALLSFGSHTITGAQKEINLSLAGNLQEAASTLFSALRELDSSEHSAIAVMSIPEDGIGAAINDRLNRAASK